MGNEQYKGKFFDTFGIIYDKRQQGKVRHKLIDILFIIVSALFAKIDEVEEIYMWATAEQNKKWLKKYIALENGIPSISTIRRVLNTVNPKQFEKCFISWTRELTIFSENGGDIVAIDGKTMRGSKNGDKITHIVNAWCSANNLVLGQVKTDEKSNEITAIPELLDLLYLEGCIVTIDAMGCQTKIVKKIKKKKADYVISLKGNQGTLHNEVKEYYEDLKEEMDKIEKGNHESVKMVRTLDKGHGRIEERKYFYSTDIDWMIDARKDWTGLSGIGMVYRKVTEKDKVREEVQYYIGSIKDVSQFAKAVRGHWGVESMHWSLDVTFKDDANKTRKDLAPENLAVAKRIVLNMVRRETEEFPKLSANLKTLKASLDVEYRTRVFDINFKK
ncbi:MAG: ISAs1 family transposase [Clostridiales bacterium]|nr:ISAs1 family transposase [Clostridiales bacterium]